MCFHFFFFSFFFPFFLFLLLLFFFSSSVSFPFSFSFPFASTSSLPNFVLIQADAIHGNINSKLYGKQKTSASVNTVPELINFLEGYSSMPYEHKARYIAAAYDFVTFFDGHYNFIAGFGAKRTKQSFPFESVHVFELTRVTRPDGTEAAHWRWRMCPQQPIWFDNIGGEPMQLLTQLPDGVPQLAAPEEWNPATVERRIVKFLEDTHRSLDVQFFREYFEHLPKTKDNFTEEWLQPYLPKFELLKLGSGAADVPARPVIDRVNDLPNPISFAAPRQRPVAGSRGKRQSSSKAKRRARTDEEVGEDVDITEEMEDEVDADVVADDEIVQTYAIPPLDDLINSIEPNDLCFFRVRERHFKHDTIAVGQVSTIDEDSFTVTWWHVDQRNKGHIYQASKKTENVPMRTVCGKIEEGDYEFCDAVGRKQFISLSRKAQTLWSVLESVEIADEEY